MRLAALVLAFPTLLVAFDAIAQARRGPKAQPVEVTNFPDPQNVVVTNELPSSPPARFQLVGFTTTTYTGDLGGPFGATEKCQTEFPDSRMCLAGEAQQTTTLPTGLSGQAWLNLRLDGVEGPISLQCQAWTNDDFGVGSTIDAVGFILQGFNCRFPLAIACCALVP